jgi:hypothetical protein
MSALEKTGHSADIAQWPSLTLFRFRTAKTQTGRANAKYVSFFIPDKPGVELPEAIVLNQVAEILTWPETVAVQSGIGEEKKDGRELVFTGQIYLYSERPVTQDLKQRMIEETAARVSAYVP